MDVRTSRRTPERGPLRLTAPKRADRKWKARRHGDLTITIDHDRRVTQISPAAAAWCGGRAVEFVGVNARERWPAPAALEEAVEAALTKGATSRVEYASLIVPGRWVEVDIEPLPVGARVRIRDITARVLAEQSLEAPVGLGDPSLTSGPAELLILDSSGVIVAANAAWRAGINALGLALRGAGVGARFAAVAKAAVPKTDEAAFQARLDELFSGRVSQFEATFSQDTPDGTERRQVRIQPLRIGETTYFLAILEDLTDRAKVLAALHATSDQLLHAQERERERIALELHDSMGQYFAGLTLGLAQLRGCVGQDRAATQARIDDMLKLAGQASREMRVLSYLMNAMRGRRDGFASSVQRFAEGFGRRTGLTTSVETEGPVDDVNAAVQHAVFRVIQEALSNVHRHAHATSVQVTLANQGGALRAIVSDDGRGIRLATDGHVDGAALGVGIMGMRARIEQLGGSLAIKGSPAGGTTIAAVIPVI